MKQINYFTIQGPPVYENLRYHGENNLYFDSAESAKEFLLTKVDFSRIVDDVNSLDGLIKYNAKLAKSSYPPCFIQPKDWTSSRVLSFPQFQNRAAGHEDGYYLLKPTDPRIIDNDRKKLIIGIPYFIRFVRARLKYTPEVKLAGLPYSPPINEIIKESESEWFPLYIYDNGYDVCLTTEKTNTLASINLEFFIIEQKYNLMTKDEVPAQKTLFI